MLSSRSLLKVIGKINLTPNRIESLSLTLHESHTKRLNPKSFSESLRETIDQLRGDFETLSQLEDLNDVRHNINNPNIFTNDIYYLTLVWTSIHRGIDEIYEEITNHDVASRLTAAIICLTTAMIQNRSEIINELITRLIHKELFLTCSDTNLSFLILASFDIQNWIILPTLLQHVSPLQIARVVVNLAEQTTLEDSRDEYTKYISFFLTNFILEIMDAECENMPYDIIISILIYRAQKCKSEFFKDYLNDILANCSGDKYFHLCNAIIESVQNNNIKLNNDDKSQVLRYLSQRIESNQRHAEISTEYERFTSYSGLSYQKAPNHKCGDDWILFFYACSQGDKAYIEKALRLNPLLAHLRSNNNQTALHIAAINSQPFILETLLNHGSNQHARDNYNKTFFDYLTSSRCLDLIGFNSVEEFRKAYCPHAGNQLNITEECNLDNNNNSQSQPTNSFQKVEDMYSPENNQSSSYDEKDNSSIEITVEQIIRPACNLNPALPLQTLLEVRAELKKVNEHLEKANITIQNQGAEMEKMRKELDNSNRMIADQRNLLEEMPHSVNEYLLATIEEQNNRIDQLEARLLEQNTEIMRFVANSLEDVDQKVCNNSESIREIEAVVQTNTSSSPHQKQPNQERTTMISKTPRLFQSQQETQEKNTESHINRTNR